MNMSRSPGVGVVPPWVGSRPNRQESIPTGVVRQTTSHPKEVWIQRSRPLIPLVQVASRRVCLPDLQQHVGDGVPGVIQDPPGDDDPLPERFPPGARVSREVGVFRGDGADGGTRSRQLGKSSAVPRSTGERVRVDEWIDTPHTNREGTLPGPRE